MPIGPSGRPGVVRVTGEDARELPAGLVTSDMDQVGAGPGPATARC